MIEVKNLSKHYGDLLVLDRLSFEINKGEILSIVGPSGSGKTTVLKCVTGLKKMDGGQILVDGVDQNSYLAQNRISLVSQKYSNFHWLSVRQNVELGMAESQQKDSVDEILERFAIRKFQDYYPHQLSGGMQQRVAIARSILQETDYMALDEPFSALDYATRSNLQLFLKKLSMEQNKGILFVTHDIEEALFVSDRLIVVSDRPCRIVHQEMDLPYKREMNKEILFEPGFVEMRKSIMSKF